MKTFQDLEFNPHPADPDGILARIFFDNGFGVSVIQNSFSYTENQTQYELAVLKGNISEWKLCYTTPITSDVIGYLSEQEVTEIMQKVQDLEAV